MKANEPTLPVKSTTGMNTESVDVHTYNLQQPTQITGLGHLKNQVRDMTSAVNRIAKKPEAQVNQQITKAY